MDKLNIEISKYKIKQYSKNPKSNFKVLILKLLY